MTRSHWDKKSIYEKREESQETEMMLLSTLSVSSKVLPRYFRHGSSIIPMTRGYHENIVEHYENPRNVGAMNKNDDDVGTVRMRIGTVRCI